MEAVHYLWTIIYVVQLLSSTAKTSLSLRLPVTTILYVDRSSGEGNFTTIQAAIDSISPNNVGWIQINVAAGIYTEKVTIPESKPFLYIQGMGEVNTRLEWNDHGEISSCSTFNSLAENVIVRNITFVNTFNYPLENNVNPKAEAVAAKISGDKTAFYGVTFLSVQDTLYDDKGRHYFHSCTIEGTVDFIFGAGQSIYEKCMIEVNGVGGAITAQGRINPYDTNGFVFKECTIFGKGPTLLGRAWKPYSRVFFIQTTMADVIAPDGWDSWEKNVNDITFGEYNCLGPGSNQLGRVVWEKTVSPVMAQNFGSIEFIDADGWIADQPGITPVKSNENYTFQYDGNTACILSCNDIRVIIYICILTLLLIIYSN